MHRNKSVNQHQFAMIPRSDIPRAKFDRETGYKTTMNSGYLVPFFLDEVLPGDVFNFQATIFARLATPLVPFMDNLYADTFFFFVPNRLVWDNWVKMNGEQDNPADSISYTVPQIVSKASGYDIGSIYDYLGLPTLGQLQAAATFSHSALPLRGLNLIWNDWFRDENLQNSVVENRGNGPDLYTDYNLMRRGKRKDYFTSALPFAQKGAAVTLPLGTQAPVKGLFVDTSAPAVLVAGWKDATGGLSTGLTGVNSIIAGPSAKYGALAAAGGNPQIYADLSAATAATINQLRQSFQIQKLLERDARGGTRYSELLQSHFGVNPQDFRLQRPEYLGGGSTPVNINPIAQASGTGASGTTTPLGQLAAMGTLLAKNGFSYSALEHGHIFGLVSIRADLTYQQGTRKLWNRQTRYDFYMPEFAMLGEQAVLNQEIYTKGIAADTAVFGYQERWAEYRYFPSLITGQFRSTSALPLDIWHLAQNFTSLPTLNDTFIQDTPPVARVVAVPSQPQFLTDIFMKIRTVRPLPMYSVPGLIDHF
ncbi:MAG: major capsid protein [Microviridae sp.]|nr:MAG: major capsid protein [Microviridae sp.]